MSNPRRILFSDWVSIFWFVAGVLTNSGPLQSAALAQAPVILVQPLSQSVPAGATVTFGVAASGNGQLQYQWKRNGVDLAGQAGVTLTINSATSADAGDYSVVVSNNLGSTTSAAARLTVGGVQAPAITGQPVNQSVTAGANVTFKVSASGSAPLSFQWKKNGIDLAGQTSSSLNLNAVTTGDAGNYSVAVSNAAGTTTSTIAALTVTEPAGPVIVVQPVSQTVEAGARVTFNVSATGSGQLSYQWKRNGVNLSGQTGAMLTLNAAAEADEGDYTVVVSNSAGTAVSAVATLDVGSSVAPRIVLQPIGQSVEAGGQVVLRVGVTGSAPLTFQWRKNGANLSGQTGASLTLNNVTAADAGDYSVVVTNSVGTETSSAARVEVTADVPDAPVIVVQPISQTVPAGANVSFTVAAEGSGQLRYQWKKNGVDLAGQTSATLSLSGVAAIDAGDYSVVVSNEGGATASAGARLTVGAVGAPVITVQPASQTVTVGGSVSLTVRVEGAAPLLFQWKKNGVNISGAINSSLTLNSVTSADAGNYSVVVSNSAGATTSASATVLVSGGGQAPLIVVPPLSQTVAAGGTVVLKVEAAGSGALSYQWKLNGANLSGANSATLTLQNVQASNAGKYEVIVSDSQGGSTKAEAEVKVVSGTGPGGVDTGFVSDLLAEIHDLAAQADGKVVVAGHFTAAGSIARNRIARLNADGSLDASFGVGAGANDDVLDAEVQADGKIVIGGEFTALHEAGRNRIGRLNADGSLDGSFNVGAGASGPVRAVAIDSNGKVIIAGDFATVNGQSRPGIARLNGDGSLDINFNVGAGANGPVTDAELQSDGKIVIAGEFTSVQGAPRLGVARLNVDGSLDTSFAAGLSGTTGLIHDVEVQSDGKILVSGSFGGVGGVARVNLARLNADGSVDAGFNANLAAGSIVADVEAQADGKVLVGGQIAIGGAGTIPKAVVRLNGDGSVDTSFDASVAGPVADVELQGDGKILVGSGASGVLRLNGSISLPQGRIVRLLKSGATVELSVATEAGKTHVLETQTDITAQNWTELSTAVGDGSVKVFTDASATGSARFYRVRIR